MIELIVFSTLVVIVSCLFLYNKFSRRNEGIRKEGIGKPFHARVFGTKPHVRLVSDSTLVIYQCVGTSEVPGYGRGVGYGGDIAQAIENYMLIYGRGNSSV